MQIKSGFGLQFIWMIPSVTRVGDEKKQLRNFEKGNSESKMICAKVSIKVLQRIVTATVVVVAIFSEGVVASGQECSLDICTDGSSSGYAFHSFIHQRNEEKLKKAKNISPPPPNITPMAACHVLIGARHKKIILQHDASFHTLSVDRLNYHHHHAFTVPLFSPK